MHRSVVAPGLATIDRLWTTETDVDRATRTVVLIAAGTALLWLSAKIQIPFWPVPATLQTMIVVLIGAFYGSRLGLATVVAYLAEGLAGLPVFVGTPAKGLGLVYMAGPTGGYLNGFAIAAFVIGALVERGWGRSIGLMLAATLIANAAIYACGLSWLGYLIGADKAVAFGLMPFLASDAVKILIATGVTVAASRAATA